MRLSFLFIILASVAQAAPETSSRPALRGGEAGEVSQAAPRLAMQALAVSQRPVPRASVAPDAVIPAMARKRERKGAGICGDPSIEGEVVGAVPGRIAGCGIGEAVRVTAVDGIRLSQPSLMDCTTARAVKTWINDAARPALRGFGGGLERLSVAAHYACRTRNNQPGARISEHGKGKAIDISGFGLKDGSQITVLKGWNEGRSANALRRVHQGACGPFGTVLGPESDRFHRDHFHFDTAQHRGGPFCR